MQLKMYFFVRFVRPCMHHNYGGISESHACKDCLWPKILDAKIYTTFPGERVLVVMTHQVQCNIPTFEVLISKNMHLFLERRRRSTNVMVACFWRSQIVYILPYSLNTTTAFYLVTECPDLTMLFWGRVQDKRIRTSLGLSRGWTLTCDFRVLLWMYCCTECYELANNSVKKVSVILWSWH